MIENVVNVSLIIVVGILCIVWIRKKYWDRRKK